MRKRIARSGGLLVELLTATAVFMVLTQVFFSLNERKMQALRMSEERTLAVLAAQAELARVRTLPGRELDRLDGHRFSVKGLAAPDNLPGSLRVEKVEGHPDLFRVIVSIGWIGVAGRSERPVSIEAVVRPGRSS